MFYIRENNEWVEYDILVGANLTTTFDETLDNMEVILASSSNSQPIAPDTLCKFVHGDDVFLFIVAVDTPELISRVPERYQHKLSLVQNTRLLSKHLVRNCVFSQPARYLRTWSYRDTGVLRDINFLIDAHPDNKEILDEKCTISVVLSVVQTHTSSSYSDADLDFFDFQWNNEITPNTWNDFTENDEATIHVIYNLSSGSSSEQTANVPLSDIVFGKPVEIKPITRIRNISSINVYVSFNGNYQIRLKPSVVSAYGINSYILHCKSSIQTYYYTVWDVINTLRLIQAKNTNEHTNDYLFEEPESDELLLMLMNTIAPNFSFVGCSMYDCLSEIFKLFDATFTIDENNRLGIEYFNKQKNTITSDFSNRILSVSEDRYNLGSVNTFQDAIIEEEVIVPVRRKELGIVANDEDYILELPHEIVSISKMEIFVKSKQYDTSTWIKDTWLDVSEFVVGEQIYSLLETEISHPSSDLVQYNTLSWSGNTINVGGKQKQWGWGVSYGTLKYFISNAFVLFSDPNNRDSASMPIARLPYAFPDDFKNVKFRIKYRARTNGRLLIENTQERYKGEMVVNQANGQVDINKLGLNIVGLNLKLGNPTLSMTQKIGSWSDRIVKGDVYTYNGDKYIANVVKYTFFNDYILTNVEFVKNYNALSSRVQIDREKRLSNISNELITMAEENYIEYVEVEHGITIRDKGEDIYINTNVMFSNIAAAFGVDFNYTGNIDFATISTYYYTGASIKSNIFIPLTKYASGLNMCFEMKMNSPISAGNQTTFGTKIITKSVLYTDDSGWADLITFTFYNFNSNSFSNSFPVISSAERESTNSAINKLAFYKQPNEVIGLNYEIQFTSKEGIVGNEFIKNLGFLKGISKKTMYLYATGSKGCTQADIKIPGSSSGVPISVNFSSNGKTLQMALFSSNSSLPPTINNWAIGDEDRNLYVAFNDTFSTRVLESISFILRHNRL